MATERALESQRIGGLQIRVALLCALVQTFDGYDLNAIGMAAPALRDAWGLRWTRNVRQPRGLIKVEPGESPSVMCLSRRQDKV